MDKQNYRVITFEGKIKEYNPADWLPDVPGGIALFSTRCICLGLHYRRDGKWYSSADWAGIPDEYSLTADKDIGYTLNMSALIVSAEYKLLEETKEK